MMRFLVKIYVILVDSIRENDDSWNPLYRLVENSKLFIIYFLSGSWQNYASEFPNLIVDYLSWDPYL